MQLIKNGQYIVCFLVIVCCAIMSAMAAQMNLALPVLIIVLGVLAAGGAAVIVRVNTGQANNDNIKYIVDRINQNDLLFDFPSQAKSELMTAARYMVDNLKQNFRKQVEISSDISVISGKLTDIAKQSATASDGITSAAIETCAHSEEQSKTLKTVLASVQEITGTLAGVTGEMQETAQITALSIGAAQEGIAAARHIEKNMEKVQGLYCILQVKSRS